MIALCIIENGSNPELTGLVIAWKTGKLILRPFKNLQGYIDFLYRQNFSGALIFFWKWVYILKLYSIYYI